MLKYYLDGFDFTPEQYELISKTVADTYRGCMKRINYMEYMACIHENQKEYDDDRTLVKIVDFCMENCSKETQLIIRNEFLQEPEKGWFLNYFTRSSYYRIRKKAVQEFAKNLIV